MARELTLDRLAESAEPAQVVWLDEQSFGGPGRREPHRHDYHELIWVRRGSGRHRIDGEPLPVVEHTITVIGRGQVHVFEEGHGLSGAVVCFGDELLMGTAQRATPGWLLAGRGGRTVPVPAGDADSLEAVLRSLSRALSQVTGRATKELVLDRVMLEAARPVRFTDLSVGEIAFRVGYEDPLYFSRAFKRRFGDAPMPHRARVQGKAMPS